MGGRQPSRTPVFTFTVGRFLLCKLGMMTQDSEWKTCFLTSQVKQQIKVYTCSNTFSFVLHDVLNLKIILLSFFNLIFKNLHTSCLICKWSKQTKNYIVVLFDWLKKENKQTVAQCQFHMQTISDVITYIPPDWLILTWSCYRFAPTKVLLKEVTVFTLYPMSNFFI